jgi:hypothetical protein
MERKGMKKRRILLLSFIIIAITSAIFNALPTLNYFEFYKALSGIFVEVDAVYIDVKENTLNITIKFNLVNPTGYTGIKVRSLRYILYFQYKDALVKLLEGEFLWDSQEGIPLNAHSNITCSQIHVLTTKSATANQLIRILNDEVYWIVESRTILHTFAGSIMVPLNSVTPKYVRINK